jgi:hypothetical protein
MLVVKFDTGWRGPADKAAVPFADVLNESLDAEVKHAPCFIDN